MKGKRDMFYSDYQAGGFVQPQPQGFYTNQQYQAFGPNVIPNNMQMNQNQYQNQTYTDDYENRFNRIESTIRKLDARLSKLEASQTETLELNNNSYII